MKGHPLAQLEAYLRARPGVTVHSNGHLVQAGMPGKPAVYIGWNTKREMLAWHRGERQPGEGEPLNADPEQAADQVVKLLEADPEPWYSPAPWWRTT